MSTNAVVILQAQILIENKSLCYWLQQMKTYNKYLTALIKATRKIIKAIVATNYLKY